ncbi:exodeoxyribonuclease V subunit alpha [uncultured Acinetobacter sp.]|uniref:exodeoxyribonuclease V subunit alpha n=1 Tax=uncultured Acinetobacter sp. TaxID=165433 RepID=UPI0026289DBD|nr:exodeoxyribonuclease V subunit alpha [uncultured Acinetobacter sp.]
MNISTDNDVAWMKAWSGYFADTSLEAQKLIQELLLAMQSGHSCLQALPEQVSSLGTLVAAPHAIAPFIYDQSDLYLYRYWQLEQQLTQDVQRLIEAKVTQVAVADDQELLTDVHQKAALHAVAQQGLSIITGGPGTGKTYTLARIIAALNQALPNLRIAMAAPTGKAAQRMKEALQSAFNDPKLEHLVSDDLKHLQPITLHRLLGLGTQHKPRFSAKQPLPFDVVVVDEASMLDLNLAALLFNAIANGTRLILLGDAQQLASVDVGSVLADLQQVECLDQHRVHLHTSRRFKAGAAIGELAGFIQAPHMQNSVLHELEQLIAASTLQAIELTTHMSDVVQLEYLPEHLQTQQYHSYYDRLMFGFSGYVAALQAYLSSDGPDTLLAEVLARFDDYRILTAIRHGPLGLKQLNQQIEKRLLQQLASYTTQQGDWYVGRAVMMTYNDYQLVLSNGDIGVCLQRFKDGQWQFEVYFPSLEKWLPAARLPKNIETAFALTIHKSQGSEFKHTAVVLDGAAANLLSQELLYTAITRAKSVVSILADPKSLQQALTVKTTRQSGLKNKLKTT